MIDTVKDLIASIQNGFSLSPEGKRALYLWEVTDLSRDLQQIYSICKKQMSEDKKLKELYDDIFAAIDFITTNDKEWDPDSEEVKDIIDSIDKFTDAVKDIDMGPTDEDLLKQAILDIREYCTPYEGKRTVTPLGMVNLARAIGNLDILCKEKIETSPEFEETLDEVWSCIEHKFDGYNVYWELYGDPDILELIEMLDKLCNELEDK